MHSRAGGGSQGRSEGGEMALLSWWQPQSEAEGWREDSYLSTMRSRCRFFCLSWLFLLACNLRLAWLLSSWVARAPVLTERRSYQRDS